MAERGSSGSTGAVGDRRLRVVIAGATEAEKALERLVPPELRAYLNELLG